MIISIYVSMFTALINLFVDFLFVDILFAPTIDSSKRDAETISDKGISAASKETAGKALNSVTEVRDKLSIGDQSNVEPRKFSLTKMQSGKFDLETTRVVPSSTQEAHSLAVLCVKDLIKDRDSEMKSSQSRRDMNRQSSSLLKQKHSLEKHRGDLKARGESSKVKKSVSLILDKTAVEEQFVDLTVDIIEQRKTLKRSQQERFDEMWG